MGRRTHRITNKKMGTLCDVVDPEERYGYISSPPKKMASGPLVSNGSFDIKLLMNKCVLLYMYNYVKIHLPTW